MVFIAFHLSGDIASFDEGDFKSKLAANLFDGCPTGDIDVLVTSGSMRVQADVIAPNASVASRGINILTNSSTAHLSLLLDQMVQTAQIMEVMTVRVAAPSPPPPLAPPPPTQPLPPLPPPDAPDTISVVSAGALSGTSSDSDAANFGLMVGGAVSAAALVIATACAAYVLGIRRGQRLRTGAGGRSGKRGRVPTYECEFDGVGSVSSAASSVELPRHPSHPDPDCCSAVGSSEKTQSGRLAVRQCRPASPSAVSHAVGAL